MFYFEDVVYIIYYYLEDIIFVVYNVYFDYNFLVCELVWCGMLLFIILVIDIVELV